MRQFKLINANGQEFDLMDKTTFFQSPSGLGFENDLEYINAGYSFIETDSELSQKTISGEIAFLGYDKYSKFIRFCNASPLTFSTNRLLNGITLSANLKNRENRIKS